MPVDDGVAEREVLRHADQGVVDRGVAVRVVLAEDVADDRRALAELGVRQQAQVVPHVEDDAALHRLEAVAHVGQGARGDDGQGVVEVAALGLVVEGMATSPTARGVSRRRPHRTTSRREMQPWVGLGSEPGAPNSFSWSAKVLAFWPRNLPRGSGGVRERPRTTPQRPGQPPGRASGYGTLPICWWIASDPT